MYSTNISQYERTSKFHLDIGRSIHTSCGHAMAENTERYKPEGLGFDFRWFVWNILWTLILWPHYGPGVDSASNRNEYREYFLGAMLAVAKAENLLFSCANYLGVWEPQPPGILRTCTRLLYRLYIFLANWVVTHLSRSRGNPFAFCLLITYPRYYTLS